MVVDPWQAWHNDLNALMTAHFPDRRAVPGAGNAENPPLMFIGEAPGGQEEAQGTPFVGQAGQQLQGFLDAVGLRRDAIQLSSFQLYPSSTYIGAYSLSISSSTCFLS